ncbi:receptor activity-modifying protein 2 isoform X1 [Myotis myotis]|uniref:Receptor activity-modifying protein 2 n=2 Tax=Myotis myotis TaxID=51298 RepID=A0A7J7T7S3_MYOMY|nr:receptor activity-modifying protein 2 isoform X1 [Myotis myotis]KAF6296741.1 receptor activity modifying protein 2 [Myotis myotis]
MASLRAERPAGGPRTPATRAGRPTAFSLLLLLGATLKPQGSVAQLPTTAGSLESGVPTGKMETYDESISRCWGDYQVDMDNIKEDWCDWAMISRPYSDLQECLEREAEHFDLGFPNPSAEQIIFKTHQTHFANCTLAETTFSDPPEDVLLAMIIAPICLIPFLVTLVVWKSKDSEARA